MAENCKPFIIPLFGLVAATFVAGCVGTAADIAIGEPDPELVFVRGYHGPTDECQLVGESAFSSEFLDDAADLVACSTGSGSMSSLMAETGAATLTQTNSFTFFSIPYR